MISSGHKIKVSTNRHVLEKIIEVILLCGRQNIPLRGHVEERSNFIAILHEKAKTEIFKPTMFLLGLILEPNIHRLIFRMS